MNILHYNTITNSKLIIFFLLQLLLMKNDFLDLNGSAEARDYIQAKISVFQDFLNSEREIGQKHFQNSPYNHKKPA